MRQKSETRATTPEQIVKDIRRATRKHHSAEEKIRIILEGIRHEVPVRELCRREGIQPNVYYSWLKHFMEAGKERLTHDTARDATRAEVEALKRENQRLKQLVAELSIEVYVLKKSGLPELKE
jgi:transposase